MGIRETIAAMGRGKRVACGACAVALAAGLGLGGAYAAGAWPGGTAAEAPAATTAAAEADETTWAVRVGVKAEGWDAGTSSPVICHVTGAGGEVDFYHAYDANADESVEVAGEGDYEVTFVTPVNADGSIYRVGDAVAAAAEATDGDAAEGAGLDDPVATFTRVDAADVTADELTKVVEQVAEAVKRGDETLSGDAGAKVAQAVAANAKANANADASKVEERASAAESTAKEGKSEAKTATSSKKASASSSSSSNKTPASHSSTPASSSGASSPSGGSGQQASSHQHSWSPVYRSETTYTTVDVYDEYENVSSYYICSVCGAEYDTYDAWSAHSDAMLEQGSPHSACYEGSRGNGTYTKIKIGERQEATGTRQVLDHYECSCGATKAA